MTHEPRPAAEGPISSRTPTGTGRSERPEQADAGRTVSDATPRRPLSDLPVAVPAMLAGLRFAGYAVAELFSVLWLSLVLCLAVVGVGLPLLPGAVELTRSNAERQRRAAYELSGVPVLAHYRQVPRGQGWLGLGTVARRAADPMTWRDLVWHIVNPAIGLTIGVTSLVLTLFGVWGLVLVLGPESLREALISTGSWYGVLPISIGGFTLVGIQAVIALIAGPLLARPMLRLHGHWTHLLLGGDPSSQLRQRVESLEQTRTTALDIQQAEIQRIERDLHDGAQARLVSMGMTISQAERLMESDPERAAELLAAAKHDSKEALQEIRSLVRGIRPPVLADRGLTEALRALAAQSPVATDVESTLDRKLSSPLESALYFGITELVTNAVKHAEADRITIRVVDGPDRVRATITDNGRGGAEESPGGGLAGIRRRLEPFDGTLVLTSPTGGPTTAVITVPTA